MKYPHHPPVDHFQLSAILQALGDPTRLRILRDLAGVKEQCCGDFHVTDTKSTLSHHLKVLREAGVVRTRIDGVKRFVSLRRYDLEARFPGLLAAILNPPRKAHSPHTGQQP